MFENIKNIATGNLWKIISAALTAALIALGFYTVVTIGERNVYEERVNTRDATIGRKDDAIKFQTEWMKRDALDAQAKDAEYNRTIASKPKYITKIEYVSTGDKCADYEAIINAARANQEATR